LADKRKLWPLRERCVTNQSGGKRPPGNRGTLAGALARPCSDNDEHGASTKPSHPNSASTEHHITPQGRYAQFDFFLRMAVRANVFFAGLGIECGRWATKCFGGAARAVAGWRLLCSLIHVSSCKIVDLVFSKCCALMRLAPHPIVNSLTIAGASLAGNVRLMNCQAPRRWWT